MNMLAPFLFVLLPTPGLDPGDLLAAPVRLESGGVPIDVSTEIGHAGPALFDLDGDGSQELLVGTFRGVVDVYEREALSTSPAWKKRGRLQAAGEDFSVPNW